MKPWMIALLGGLVLAGVFKLTETPIPEGVDPSLSKNDVVACTTLQTSLKVLKSVVEIDSSTLDDQKIEPELFKSEGREIQAKSVIPMSPRTRAAFSLTSDELLNYPAKNLTYEEANSLFSASLVKLDPALQLACSHVSN